MEVMAMHVRPLPFSKLCAGIAAGLILAVGCGSSAAQQQNDDSYTQYSGREHGSLGVSLTDNHRGDVWVTTVVPTSPADRAGLRPGDQIVAFDNQAVHSYRDAVHIINQKGPHDRLAVHVLRNGQVGTLMANLVPQQILGEQGGAMAGQGSGPGYFPNQQGQMHASVLPAPGYYGNSNQSTFAAPQQSSYNSQQSGNMQPSGYRGRQGSDNNAAGILRPMISAPPLVDETGNGNVLQPTGPQF
jgi:membrane-associated protease RseP (regulator of RpoE activity)